MGKDAEKLSAAEARARAREEARRRRAQAKEQKSGPVAEEAVRPPEEPAEGDLDDDVYVVEYLTEQTIEAEPFKDETVADETVAEQTVIAEPIVDEPVAEEPAVDNRHRGARARA